MRIATDINEDMAEDAIHEPGREASVGRFGDLAESDFEFVETVLAGLIHARRLAGRADEEAREHVRERGMIEPVADHAAEEVRASQERAVGRRGGSEHEMVAAAGAAMAAV